LKPAIDEWEQLQGILSLLKGEGDLQAANGVASSQEVSALLERAGIPKSEPIRRSRKGTKPGRDGRAPQGANKQLIIESVLEDPGVTATEIAERTGVKRTVVSATINRLKRNGELEPHGQGVRIPPARRVPALTAAGE
jgi:predicted HTH transcriptional regulator